MLRINYLLEISLGVEDNLQYLLEISLGVEDYSVPGRSQHLTFWPA